MRLAIALVIAALVPAVARADVIFEEPTQITCGRAEVLVEATVTGTTAKGPFTNAAPPSVKVTATHCWKGCKAGDKLTVARWVDAKPSHSGKPAPADPKAEDAAWAAAPVVPPVKGTRVLLWLRHDGRQLLRVQDSGGYGGYVMRVPTDDQQTERAVGMCQVGMGFAGERDRTAVAGQPVMVHVDIGNRTDGAVVVHGESIRLKLQTDTRPGEDLAPTWGASAPKRVTLKAKGTLALDWDLAKLFPGQFVKPGAYWLTLDAPAALTLQSLAITVK